MMLDPRTRSARPGTRRLALLMVLGLVLAACDLEDLGDPDAVEDDEDVTVDDEDDEDVAVDDELPEGGVVTIARSADVDNLDPHLATAFQSRQALELIYETLTEFDEDLEVQPGLAEDWGFSDDGLTLTFQLRDDVRFHDGQDLTAADVVATVERLTDPDSGAVAGINIAAVDSVDAPDDHTVEISLSEPDVSLLAAFADANAAIVDPANPYTADNQGVIWIDFDQIGGKIYVGVADPDDPLYVSEDGGATWQPVPGAVEALGEVDGNRTIPKQSAVDHVNGYLYVITSYDPGPYNGVPDAGGNGGQIWRLTTRTGEWTDITPGYNPRGPIPGFGGITVDRQNPGTLMASTCNNWHPDEILYRSTDSGETWSLSWDYAEGQDRTDRFAMDNSGSPWLNWNGEDQPPRYAVKHGWMIEAFAIDPHDSDRLMWGTGATIWGTEELTRWDTQGELIGEDESGQRVALPIEKFTVGVRVEGLEETAVLDLAALGGTLVSAMGDIAGFVHTDLDRAEPMIDTDWSTGTSVDFAQFAPDIIVCSGNVRGEVKGHVGVSTDRGKTWRNATRVEGVPGDGHGGTVAVSADGSRIFWTPSNSEVTPVYSTDLGETWIPVAGLPAGAKIRSDRVRASVLYAFSGGTFYRSTDGGATFTDTGATGLPTAAVEDFRAVPGHKNHVWLAGRGDTEKGIAGGMWRSKDGGATWKQIAGFETAESVGFGKAAKKSGYPAIYTSAEIGGKAAIFRSTDGGNRWTRINDDDHQWAWSGSRITGDPLIYGRVYLTTNGRGIIYGDIAG
jgi:hypothetical protein